MFPESLVDPSFRMGDVTFNMVLDRLQPCEILYQPEGCQKHFSWYATVFRMDEDLISKIHRSKTLFLCHARDARVLLDAHPGCFCVIVDESDKTPAWVLELAYRNRVIVLKQNRKLYHYDALLQSLFIGDLVWENEMDRVVYNRGRLDRLISVSENMLRNFVCITDSGFNLITYSHGVRPQGDGYVRLVQNGCYDKDEMAVIEEKVLPRAKRTSQLVVLDPDEHHPWAVMHYPVFIDNAYLFHVTMTCVSGSVDFLRDMFLKFMRRVISICNDFWKTTVNLEAPWHRVLLGLIAGETMAEEYLDTQLAITAIPASKQFRLLLFRFSSSLSFQDRNRVVEKAKELNDGFCYPFMYEDDLLVLEYTISTNDAALSGKGVFADVGRTIYEPFGIAAGASQVFHKIEDISYAYRQARTAFELRGAVRRELQLLNGTSDIPCYAFEHALKFYAFSEGCDPDLVQFSFQRSILRKLVDEDRQNGTDIAKMVWVYLNNERNATETSKLIHVHRNTVLYHISRLEKRFDISFDSPALRSRMLLDYYQLFLTDDL